MADYANWKAWNYGVRDIQMEGPFATGTWFSMELPDGEVLRSHLVEVVPPCRFIDETSVGDTVVRVEHRIESTDGGQCRVEYAVMAEGPEAQAIGEIVSADFPDVLAQLERYLVVRAVGSTSQS